MLVIRGPEITKSMQRCRLHLCQQHPLLVDHAFDSLAQGLETGIVFQEFQASSHLFCDLNKLNLIIRCSE